MTFNDLARKRYSCRKLAAKPVEQEKIDAIVEAGILAPTAVNKQPFRIWVAKSPVVRLHLIPEDRPRSHHTCHKG